MDRGRWMLLGAFLVLIPAISTSDGATDREPSPEPYSFSYQAESQGGFSSHQESGDGTGRVQGFYIIMGEDGRDRRVDYVADENGYRASISTNEMGTRAESSADAQYNVRLPSQGQLEQAKVSGEEYKYLEEQHAAERERHLTNSRRQQQQLDTSAERYQGVASTSQSSSTNQQLAWNRQQQQQRQATSTQVNSTAVSEDSDEGWRRSAKLIGNQPLNQSQQQQQQQTQLGADERARFSASSASSWANQSGDGPQRAQLTLGSLASATTAGPIATLLNAPPAQRQQAQQAAWQLADRGAAPARLSNIGVSNNNNNYLQRQLEQQFMQQAYQLTDQDYPRQQVPLNQQAGIDHNSQFVALQQRPQQVPTPVDQQRPWQLTGGNNDRVVSTSSDYGQVSQQQNNIIDEVSGEQVDAQVGPTDDGSKSVGGNYSTTASVQFVQEGQKQANFQSSEQQQRPLRPQFIAPATTTTTSQPAPTGFFAINLSQGNSTASVLGQRVDQEVSTKQPQQQNLEVQTQSLSTADQKTNQDQSVQAQKGGDYQQVTVQQPQQTVVPNAINQVIETNNQQASGSLLKFEPTTTQDSRLETTTQAPEFSTITAKQQQKTQQVVETSQAPLKSIAATTTTTEAPSERPTVFQQFVTSTAPSRVPYDTPVVSTSSKTFAGDSFLQQSSKRPFVFQTQRVEGVKGRLVNGQVNSTFFNRINEPPAAQKTFTSQRPTSENAQFTLKAVNSTRTDTDYQQSTVTSDRPEVIYGNQLVIERAPKLNNLSQQTLQQQQQVPYQRPNDVFDYNRQQDQTQAVTIGQTDSVPTPIAFTTTRPARIETIEAQQQTSKGGVKGGSKVGRRQFWLQQQPQQPLIPSSQRVFPSIANRSLSQAQQQQQPAGTAPSRASVDYATSVSSFGSRISGR